MISVMTCTLKMGLLLSVRIMVVGLILPDADVSFINRRKSFVPYYYQDLQLLECN